jgi:branched-chain amino acid aminotransferase
MAGEARGGEDGGAHRGGAGWAAPRVEPLRDLVLAPSALCLHYGLECFEGLKAFRGDDGHVRLFRPELNMQRLAASCVRLTLPAADPAQLQAAITALVQTDLAWIPAGRGFSLYLRPTVIATQTSLGVGPSDSSLLFVITSPVGPYFASGFKPISLHANTQFVRSWHGGVGDAKCGGNYAPTILPQRLAAGACARVRMPLGVARG